MATKTRKSAPRKPKEEHPAARHPAADPADLEWSGSRLPPPFEWEFPARLLPTRRDPASEGFSDAMDRALVEALRASYAQAAPGGPTAAMAAAQADFFAAYHGFLDHNVSANAIAPTCGKGCGRCCQHYVTSVHALEVALLYEHLRARPDLDALIETCRSRVADHDAWKEFCDETYPDRGETARQDLALEHYYDEGNPCPLQRPDGACGVYEHRPLTCRMYLAASHPRYCEPEDVTAPEADVFTIPPDESIAARLERLDRAVDYWGHHPDLFRSLVRLHEWRRRWTP